MYARAINKVKSQFLAKPSIKWYSKYQSDMCLKLIDMMSEGKSKTEVCGCFRGVLHGGDLIKQVYFWDPGASAYVLADPATFGRFCAADLPGPMPFSTARAGTAIPAVFS